MAGALELAALVGAEQVDAALMLAATAGRFDDGALVAAGRVASHQNPAETISESRCEPGSMW
jgi:hypothetical protein